MTDPDAAVSRSSTATERPWKPVLALGALTVVVGVVLTLNLVTAAFAINLVIGVTLFVAGFERLIDNRRAQNRALAVILGLIGATLGVLALLLPRVTLTVLAFTVGIGLVLAGVAGIALGLAVRRELGAAWLIATGVLDVVVGVIALELPRLTIAVVGVLFGLRTILAGIADITYAVNARRSHGRHLDGEAPDDVTAVSS